MTNEDYRLEELENAAVNKSNTAKRAAAAAGILAAGGAAGFAATRVVGGSEEHLDDLSEEDLEGAANAGAEQVHEQPVAPQPAPQPVAPQPVPPVEPTPPGQDEEAQVSFDRETHYYDEDNNLILTEERGTVNGREFVLVDFDGDQRADMLGVDVNGDGTISENELVPLEEGEKILMGHPTAQHNDVFIQTHDSDPLPEPEPEPWDDDDDVKPREQVNNDFDDEKTGEVYRHDYAENNEDYTNDGDVERYSAEASFEPEDTDGAVDAEYAFTAESEVADDSFGGDDADSFDIV